MSGQDPSFGTPGTPINGRRMDSMETRLSALENAMGDVREKLGSIQGTLDTLKWGIWMGVAMAGVLGALVSTLLPG